MTPRGVLFVSHEATRTGAPIELLHFLRWFKRNSNRPFSILLGAGGELAPAFEELADTWSIDRGPWRREALRTRALYAAGLGKWARRAETADAQKSAARCSPALVYTNSIASSRIIEILAPEVPILTHVHELEFSFRLLASPGLSSLLAQTRQFIACSEAVRSNLLREHAITETQVETVYESIPVAHVHAARTRKEIFEELRIPDGAQLVVGVGTAGWRKGSDLFAQLAREVRRQRVGTFFAWIGGGLREEVAAFERDIQVARLKESLRRTGEVANPADYLAAADVFVLTSREDPYPLVCLEAAALEKPIICFADAGGAPEFVEDDCGFIVPYLDVMAMAQRLIALLDSPDCRQRMGAAARRKVAERHDVDRTAPRIMEIIERTIAQAN